MLILSLDGGGIRGLFTARLLERLDYAVPNFLSRIQLFAGTSTGGILATALAAGLTPAQCVAIYRNNAAQIFSATWEHQVGSMFELNGPKYSGDGLRAILTHALGNRKMRDLDRDVLVTSCDARLRQAVRFTRQDNPELVVVEACMRTSAAEVYFPPIDGRWFDGGNAANNPAIWATIHQIAAGARISDLRLLSIGTGNAYRPPMTLGDWGARQWLVEGNLISVAMEYSASLTDRLCTELLGSAYCRLDGSVDCAMDEMADLEAKLLIPADALSLDSAISFLREAA